MFYSNQILARKGPLGLVWIAAHMDKNLKRQQVNSTSIPASVDTLLDPEVPLALRLSGQLLLGVVRIYARKVAYLQQDCDAALVKIRVALRPSDKVDLPPGSQAAPLETITFGLDPAAAAAVAARARKARGGKNNNNAGGDGGDGDAAAGGAGVGGAGSGSAAAVDGWLGPVDEDGLMLGLDEDITWDDEVLMLGGEVGTEAGGFGAGFGAGFPRFEPNSRLSFGLAPSHSGLGSQDISGVFGMYSSQDNGMMQETFDVEDEEAAAVWDLDEIEVERLRAAPSLSQPDSIGIGGALGGLMGEGEGAPTPMGGRHAGKSTVSSPGGSMMSHDAAGAGGGGTSGPNGFTPGSLPAVSGAAAGAGGLGGDNLGSMDFDIDLDVAGALPATPQPDTPAEAAAAAAADQPQQPPHDADADVDPYDLDLNLGSLDNLLPPTPAADDADDDADATGGEGGELQHGAAAGTAAADRGDGAGADAMQVDGEEQQQQQQAGGTPTKTFQRRKTRQQQQQEEEDGQAAAAAAGAGEGGDGGGSSAAAEAEEKAAAATAAKSARKRRVSGLLGLKRRVVIDAGQEGAPGGRGRGQHAPTELPAVEIRALLADRAPLLDMERVRKVGRQLQHQAGASLTAPGAARLAQQQLRSITTATTAAAAAAVDSTSMPQVGSSPARDGRTAAAAAAAAGGVAGGAAGGAAGLCFAATFGGGLGLPLELQQMLSAAAAAAAPARLAAAAADDATAGVRPAAAAAAAGDAAGVAPTAPLEEIGGLMGDEGDMEDEIEGMMGGAAAGGGVGAGGTTRCSLSLSLTRTPGSAAAAGGVGGSGGPTPGTDAAGGVAAAGSAGGSLPAGFTPGSAAGFSLGDAGFTPGFTPGSGFAGAALNPADGGHDDVLMPEDDADFDTAFDDAEKENTPAGGVAGGSAAGGKSGGAAAAGGGRMAWPADAETLELEQEDADPDVNDGGFTARTRLVVRHLQQAAAAASGGGAAGMTPTALGSKRRFSAAAAGLMAAGSVGSKGGAEGGGVLGDGPVLSFEGISRGHSRLDACRWFYEVLVLSNKGLVKLQQEQSYGDIAVTPNLAGMARV